VHILRKTLFAIAALAAVVFAVSNRDSVVLDLWPLPFEAALPLYLVVLGAVAVGLLIGVSVSWFAKERMWLRARGAEKRAESWKRAAERPATAEAPRAVALAPAQRTARIGDD
jgi:lipopolysaccharide assembly protein A